MRRVGCSFSVWVVTHRVGQDGNVKFIDKVFSNQSIAPVSARAMTRERRYKLNDIRTAGDDSAE